MAPRFQGQAFYENQKLVDQVEEIAKKKGVTTGQLALAWILAQSEFVSFWLWSWWLWLYQLNVMIVGDPYPWVN